MLQSEEKQTENRVEELTETIKMEAASIMDNLNGIEYILDAVEAVLTMMMSVETNQKAVAYMLLSCVSNAKSNTEKAYHVAQRLREK